MADELDVGWRKGSRGAPLRSKSGGQRMKNNRGRMNEESMEGSERFRAKGFELVSWVLSGFLVEGLARDRRVKRLEGRLIEMKRPPVVKA